MSKAQRFRLGLLYVLYGAIAVSGAACGIFEHQQAIDWVTDSMKGLFPPLINEVSPFFLLIILALVIYGLFRAAGSLLEWLNGISLAAHNALHTNYGNTNSMNPLLPYYGYLLWLLAPSSSQRAVRRACGR